MLNFRGVDCPDVIMTYYDDFWEDKGIQTSSIRGLEAMFNVILRVMAHYHTKSRMLGTFSKNGASKSKVILHPKNPGMS